MGITVILVLVTALVGPFFIDWTVYRSTFESYAERALGHRVTVLGEADLRLLPAPSISFSDVRVGEAEDPLLVVSRFNMRIELPSLLKGEIRVLDMELDRPHLSLSLDESGRLDWLTARTSDGALASLPPDDLAFENVSIRDGVLSIIDARSGETHRVDDANLTVSARSLAGPYKAAGSLTLDHSHYNVSLATGRAQEGEGLRIKGEVTPTSRPVNFSFDGNLTQTEKAPFFEGDFNIASVALEDEDPNTWTAQGSFTADVAEVAVPQFEFRFGPEDRRLSLTGNADLVYAGDKHFDVRARAKQIDLDRLLGGGPQQPVEVDAASSRLVSALRAVPLPSIDGAVSLDAPAVVAGGGVIQNLRLDLETMLGGWRVARLSGRLPGRTTVTTQGDLGLVPAMTYRGAVSISSDQPGALMGWWRRKDTGGVTTIEPVALEGRLNVVPEGAAIDNLRLTIAGSEARGGLSYRKPRNGNPEFSISLDADRLDLDQIESLSTLIRPATSQGADGATRDDLNVSVRLRAKEVSARGIDGKGLSLEAEYSDGGVRIDRLFADDLAGARLDVSGEVVNLFSTPEGEVKGTLDARDLSGLVALTGGLFPATTFQERLERAAGSLVPAKFDAELKAAARGEGTDMTLRLDGSAGGADALLEAELKGRVDEWRDANVDVALGLEGPDGGKLLQQLGFDVIPIEAGSGRLSVEASGVPSDGLAVEISSNIGTSDLNGSGEIVLKKDAEPHVRLEVIGKTDDLGPMALMAGRVLPVMTGTIPARLAVKLDAEGSNLRFTDIDGKVGSTAFEGNLEGNLKPAPGEQNRRFSGDLTVSALDLRGLTELVLGPDQWFSAGDGSSLWPTSSFGTPLLGDIDLAIRLTADRLTLDEGAEIASPRADLRISPTMLRLDGLSGNFAGGGLEGSLSLRRTDAEAALSGRVKLDKADLRQLVWRPDSRAVAAGSLDLFLEFEGVGRSISAIVSGLNGGGTFRMENGDFRGLNPQAFQLVTRAVDAGLDLEGAKIRDVFVNHMAAGNLPFEKVEGTLTMVGGRLSARNVVVDSRNAEIFGSAEMDLTKLALDADFSLKVDPGEDAVTGAEPQVGILFTGPLDAPRRRVDIAPFTAYLTLRAFEREVERVEKLQSEILERDRLVREMTFQKESAARRDRRAAEAAARAEEEERLRLEQENRTEDPTNSIGGSALPNEPADSEPGSDRQSNAGQSLSGPAFAERIKSLLDEPTGVETTQSIPVAKPGDNLPPLDPPVSIEDLLMQDQGGPLVLPGAP
ncbi:AsmA family protein [Rhodobacterales bacterium]|nr:AsmA family protein [Rhodobacterales bacterium]